MMSLNQDLKRDFVIMAGRIQTVSDLRSAIVIIDNVVRSQLGEYKYNTTKGIDYENNVFTSNPNLQLFEFQVRKNVLALSFVDGIESFDYNVNNNELEYSMNVRTTYGSASIQ